jgi:type I restriction enzyme, S subunit
VKYVEPNPALLERYRLEVDDILFSHINSPEHIAKTAIYSGVPSPMIHGVNLLRLQCNREVVNPRWFVQLLKHPAIRTYFRTRCKKAVNQASLNQQDIKSLSCIIPPLALQNTFNERLTSISNLQKIYQAAVEESEELFCSLQSRAFRGEL